MSCIYLQGNFRYLLTYPGREEFNSEGSKRLLFSIFPLYSRICKYEFPKRSLCLYWDNFKQSVGLQGFYQFYYTLAERASR